jgi:ADP-heptose:LPS heptosyltransferase
VLVLRALGLGDALTGVAALRGVRRAWPDRRLVLAGPPAVGAWLAGLGVVDAVLPVAGLGLLAYDGPGGHVAVDLHGRGPQSHRVLLATRPRSLVAFDCPEVGHHGPAWQQEEHEVDRWCRLVSAAGGRCGPEDLRIDVPAPRGDLVLLHPGAASGSRRWPADRWGALGARLVAAGRQVAVTGGVGERDLCARVAALCGHGARDLSGSRDVAGLAALVAGAHLLVCGDTGVAHLATAVGTPSVLLFGPTPPARWGPRIDRDRHVVLWHGDPDHPGDPHGDALDPALRRITVAEVEDAVQAELARTREPRPLALPG